MFFPEIDCKTCWIVKQIFAARRLKTTWKKYRWNIALHSINVELKTLGQYLTLHHCNRTIINASQGRECVTFVSVVCRFYRFRFISVRTDVITQRKKNVTRKVYITFIVCFIGSMNYFIFNKFYLELTLKMVGTPLVSKHVLSYSKKSSIIYLSIKITTVRDSLSPFRRRKSSGFIE